MPIIKSFKKLVLLLIFFYIICYINTQFLFARQEIINTSKISKSITIKKHLVIGTDEDDGDPNFIFFKPRSVTCDNKGNIYILDSGNYRIQVFSAKGQFKYSFGRKGQGPGELSGKQAYTIKYLNDGNIYVIDNGLRRISIFDTKGNFIHSFSTFGDCQDIVRMKNGKIIAVILRFEKEYKPLHVFSEDGKLIYKFGVVHEPSPDYFKKTKKFPDLISAPYTHSVRLVTDVNDNIYYSQPHPYNIIKYDRNMKLVKSFHKKWKLDFNSYPQIRRENDTIIKGLSKAFGGVSSITILENKYLVAQLYDIPAKERWIDIYNLNGNYIDSFKLMHAEEEVSGGIDSFFANNVYYYLIGAPWEWPRLIIYTHNFSEAIKKIKI